MMNYDSVHEILSGVGMVGDGIDIKTEDPLHPLIENEDTEQLNTEECKKSPLFCL